MWRGGFRREAKGLVGPFLRDVNNQNQYESGMCPEPRSLGSDDHREGRCMKLLAKGFQRSWGVLSRSGKHPGSSQEVPGILEKELLLVQAAGPGG